MEQQSIFERVMSRDKAGPGNESAGAVTFAETVPQQEIAAASGNKETETVKTHNRVLLMSSAGIVILGVLATAVLAQQHTISLPNFLVAQNDKPAAGTKASATTARANPASNVGAVQQNTIFNQHVEQAGVTACKGVFPALGFAAAGGATFNATTSWSDKDADQHSISSIIGMRFNTDQFNGSGASVVFSAPISAKGGCEGTFVRVVPVPQDCNSFASTLPKGSKVGQPLQGIPVITLPNGLQTLLIPSAGNGCVILTTSRMAAPAS